MPKAVKTTYTAINLETGEVYTGIDAPQSITRGETHFWQASKDFFAALLGYGTVESKAVAGIAAPHRPQNQSYSVYFCGTEKRDFLH